MSNFTDRLTTGSVQALRDAGIELVIPQAIDPPPQYPVSRTREQIELCQVGGLIVDTYVWLWFDLSSVKKVRPALTAIDARLDALHKQFLEG